MSVVTNEQLSKMFQELSQKARPLSEDPERALAVIDQVEAELAGNEVLHNAVEGIPVMASFARDCVRKIYTEASEKSITAVFTAFLYLIEKEDAIKDSIPVIGYVDDLSIFAIAKEMAKEDLERYRAWTRSPSR